MYRATRVYLNITYACVHSCFFCRWRCLVEVLQANGDSPRSSASRTIPIHPHTRQPRVYTYICYVVLLIPSFCTLYCLQLEVYNSSELKSASNLLKATARSVGRHFSHRSMPGRSFRLCMLRNGSSGPRARDLANDQPHMVRPSSPHRAIWMVAVAVFCT